MGSDVSRECRSENRRLRERVDELRTERDRLSAEANTKASVHRLERDLLRGENRQLAKRVDRDRATILQETRRADRTEAMHRACESEKRLCLVAKSACERDAEVAHVRLKRVDEFSAASRSGPSLHTYMRARENQKSHQQASVEAGVGLPE
jgi:hypothetical protein